MFLFLVSFKSFSFWSEDDIRTRCQICRKVVKYHNENPEKPIISASDNSFCKNNSGNSWCSFVEKLSQNYVNLTAEQKKNDYCIRSSTCYPEQNPNLQGPRCGSCIFMAHHLIRFQKSYQKTAFYQFCISTKPSVASLCADIEEDSVDNFLNDLNKFRNATETCKSQHFCKVKKPKVPKTAQNQSQIINQTKTTEL